MDYASVARAATAAINEAGAPVTITRREAGEFDPEAGEAHVTTWTVTCKGVKRAPGEGGITTEEGFAIQAGDMVVIVGASGLGIEPRPGDSLAMSGAAWSVVASVPIDPGGVPLAYKIQVRR